MRIVECSDHKKTYGYLVIDDITVDKVQREIYKIKNNKKFNEEYPDWTIDDVFERFPKSWKWEYISDNGSIVEI